MYTFRTYNLAVEFYKTGKTLKLPSALKDQFARAASSIALNLSEGSGRRTSKDQAHFFQIALGSTKECKAVLDIADEQRPDLMELVDKLAAHIYKLIKYHRA